MVSRPVRDREIAGSNPAFPTTHIQDVAGRHNGHQTELIPGLSTSRRGGRAKHRAGQKKGPFKSIEELRHVRASVSISVELPRRVHAIGERRRLEGVPDAVRIVEDQSGA